LRALVPIALVSLAAFAGACRDSDDTPGREVAALRNVERRIVGPAQEYAADPALRKQTETLRTSIKARREAAWTAVAKLLQPVALAEVGVEITGKATLPSFRTWYGKDDFERTFAKTYADLTPAERVARQNLTPAQIDHGLALNANDLGSWTDDDYLARIAEVKDDASVQGLGGNARVSYSPGFVRHMLGNYAAMARCLPKMGTFGANDEPSIYNFAPCYDAEFPIDAAVVKASWWRADFDMPLATHDTSAATLAAKRAGTDAAHGGWGKGTGEAKPDASQVYTVSTSDGSVFRMPGMHLATKELREWMWITLFWSPEPDSDFGADRPQAIKDLDGPWKNYKMCVVMAFDEGDPDPRGGFAGSLGDALAAMHEGKGGATWCSNPYVEKGEKNAQTNCIGCHQHGGLPGLSSAVILEDEAKFPKSGRTRIRKNFPTDYAWGFDAAPEFLARSVETQIEHFDSVDR
jgi:hypothetical protein